MIGGVHLHELIAEEVSAKEFTGGGDVVPIRIAQGHGDDYLLICR
jgi:hypothetical protein